MTRTADRPGQTVNIDLCFVPTTRAADQVIPAVSGSSGRLIVTPPPSVRAAPFPGQVFADTDHPYPAHMQAYATAAKHRHAWRTTRTAPRDPLRQQRIALGHEATRLRLARRTTRLQREQDDRAWSQIATDQRATVARARRERMTTERRVSRESTPQDRRRAQAAQAAADHQWQIQGLTPILLS